MVFESHCDKYTALAMESKSILATELQDLSKEYGLSSESETAIGRPRDDAGTLNDYMVLIFWTV